MKRIACLLALGALAITAPLAASADPGGRGHGRGGAGAWGAERGGGGWRDNPGRGPDRGNFERGRPYERGGFEPPGQGRWRERSGGAERWSGGQRWQERASDRGRVNSLGEGWREQQDEARAGVSSGQYRPLGGVLSDLRRRQPGRQLDAGLEQGRDGRPVYRVRWAAQNGQRIDYIIDARTGAILAEEGR